MKNTTSNRKVTYGFIDASNIIYGARNEGWLIDQEKLIKYLKSKFGVTKVFFYFGKDDNNKKQAKFLEKLESFGYTLRVKQIKRYGKRQKANCDVDLTLDMLVLKEKYSKAIVLTGDGDFLPLFTHLQKQKKKITILAFSRNTARDLKKFAGGNFIGLANERYLIERK